MILPLTASDRVALYVDGLENSLASLRSAAADLLALLPDVEADALGMGREVSRLRAELNMLEAK